MSVGIGTGHTAYLPPGWAAAHDGTVVPLSVLIDMDSYVEGEDRAVGELGRALARAGGATTSRPSPQQFLGRYERLAEQGADEIVSIHLSAALSGTHEAAVLAAEDAPVPVRVVDSASMGAGLGYAEMCIRDSGVADRDLARLGLLGDRDGQLQHTVGVARLDPVERDAVPQGELAREGAARPLVGEPGDVLLGLALALRADGEGALLHVDVDRAGVDARQVDAGGEGVPGAVEVHRHAEGLSLIHI